MDPRNIRTWLIGTIILSLMTIMTSLSVRNRVAGIEAIETTKIWMLTSWYGIIAQICIIAAILFVIIAIVDAL